MDLQSLSVLAVGLQTLGEAYKNGFFSKLKYDVKKKMLPAVQCIVVNDKTCKELNFANSSNVKVFKLEHVYKQMLDDVQRESLMKIKISDYDSYVMLIVRPLHMLLNAYRFMYNKANVIVLLSSDVLAKQLHINKIKTFCPDDALYSATTQGLSETEKAYFRSQRLRMMDADHNTYSCDAELIRGLSSSFGVVPIVLTN